MQALERKADLAVHSRRISNCSCNAAKLVAFTYQFCGEPQCTATGKYFCSMAMASYAIVSALNCMQMLAELPSHVICCPIRQCQCYYFSRVSMWHLNLMWQ